MRINFDNSNFEVGNILFIMDLIYLYRVARFPEYKIMFQVRSLHQN